MARRIKPYPELAKARISASQALTYLLAVIDGKAVADPERCRNARWAVDKVVPNPPQDVHQTHDGVLEFRWKS
jgi:hypothetical protein